MENAVKITNVVLSLSDDEEIQVLIDNSENSLMGVLTVAEQEIYAVAEFKPYDSEFCIYRQIIGIESDETYVSVFDEDNGEYYFAKTENTIEENINFEESTGGELTNG